MPLIKIQKNSHGEQIVDAKELYNFLKIEGDFFVWIKKRLEEYGFQKNEDFTIVSNSYLLTMDTAKELAIVENNINGKKARKYLIKCEKEAINYIFHNNSAVRKYAKELVEEATELEREIKEKNDVVEIKLKKLKGVCRLLTAYAFPIDKDKAYKVADNKYIY
ncbi:MAG: antA/AntB antirepressor family protein [Fusobacterium ulcerans]|uniref:antA/AntB antirepressor family protein n=1 Tax=Fusobacterium ulcerans TaxID=861 RepID=UPI003A85DB65